MLTPQRAIREDVSRTSPRIAFPADAEKARWETGLSFKQSCNGFTERFPSKAFPERLLVLAVRIARCTQFPRHKVIGRPRAADQDFAILELPGGAAIAVLVALHGFFVDEVGDVD